jgi:hypothetical protein
MTRPQAPPGGANRRQILLKQRGRASNIAFPGRAWERDRDKRTWERDKQTIMETYHGLSQNSWC